jgi:hypothetical protein
LAFPGVDTASSDCCRPDTSVLLSATRRFIGVVLFEGPRLAQPFGMSGRASCKTSAALVLLAVYDEVLPLMSLLDPVARSAGAQDTRACRRNTATSAVVTMMAVVQGAIGEK